MIKTNIVQIGNSKGIRLPKAVLEQCELNDQVELAVVDGAVVIKPIKSARENWDAAFQEMAANDDDALILGDEVASKWDEEEWQW
jgi:antitoxin MazE